MAATVSGATSVQNARQRPNLAATRPPLTVIEGGRSQPAMVLVARSALDELHIDLVTARAERTVYAARMHELIRATARRVATTHHASAGTVLLEMDRLTAQETMRARAMDAAACPCGCEGSGHGPADSDALAA